LTTVLFAGCATTPPPPGVSVERKSTRSVAVQSAHLRSTGNGVVVSGVLRQNLGYSSTRRGHLDVDVFGPDGKLVRHLAAPHSLFPIRRSPHATRQATYSVRLPEVPLPGSVVRVSHHPVAVAQCESSEQ
jgi:hypothetical protein